MSPIPLLNPSIRISAYEPSADQAAQTRFLLELADRHFLISNATRALVLALLHRPQSLAALEQAYQAESGQFLDGEELLALAAKTLPAALMHDAVHTPRRLPFTLSITLFPSRFAAAISSKLSWLFAPNIAKICLPLFVLLHLAVLPEAMQAAHSHWSGSAGVQLIALLLLSGLIHELGHTSACRHFGCPHGGIGFGLYFIFPAWYADVSKAWRLSRKQRAVVDLGGVYFQALLLILIDAYALASGNEFILKLIWLITFAMLFTLNPVFKFDGYWLLSDLSGRHNLHQQVQKSCADFFANLFSKSKTKLQQPWLLHTYAVLSIGYFSYFALFLLREMRTLANKLPTALALAAQQWQAAADAAQLGLATLHMATQLLWPLVLCSACFFFLNKMWRAAQQVGMAIFSARQANHPTT